MCNVFVRTPFFPVRCDNQIFVKNIFVKLVKNIIDLFLRKEAKVGVRMHPLRYYIRIRIILQSRILELDTLSRDRVKS